MTTNAGLQQKYDLMHSQGQTAWFSDGNNEREAIIGFGMPWKGKHVLEIGCGEGELARKIARLNASVLALDYSKSAIDTAKKHPDPHVEFQCADFHQVWGLFDRVVLQGVLEHFDEPWTELSWIINNLLAPGGDVITSSPCFLNTRGIVWMTLATLFDAPMSLTDLHFLHPEEFMDYAKDRDMDITVSYTDESWGYGDDMIDDLDQRLPKVYPAIPERKIRKLMNWLCSFQLSGKGATAVYRMQLR